MDTIHDASDIVELLLWLVTGITSMVFCAGVVMTNLQPYTLEDKSAITAVTNNTPDPYDWTVRDYLLMLMVADEYCPDPKCVDIKLGISSQDTRLYLTNDYVVNKGGRLQKYYVNYLSARVDDPIVSYDYYYEGEGENGRWRFTVEH